MGTPGPTVHGRKKLLKVVMHPTPNSLPIHSLQSLSLCLPQFLLMFDKWRLVTCLARDHVYMTYFLVSCLYSNFTDIFLYLESWQVVAWWWRRPCLASGHVYALCDLSPPHPAVCLHTQFLWWLISVCCFSHSVWKRSWSPTAIDLNALILSIVCVGPCPEVILPMHAHCLSWIIATYSSPSRVLGTYL